MGFKIACPNCGRRSVYEFTFGSEVKTPPDSDASLKMWRQHLYFNNNLCSFQEEWWHHTAGCGEWLKLWRDTASNEIIPKKGN